MKKITAVYFIASALTISSNSFGMLMSMRILPKTHTKKVFIPRRMFFKIVSNERIANDLSREHNDLLKQQIALAEKQHKTSQESNLLRHKMLLQNYLIHRINYLNRHACPTEDLEEALKKLTNQVQE